eukprot:15444580-Alexandrium_andersonii.AAC.1
MAQTLKSKTWAPCFAHSTRRATPPEGPVAGALRASLARAFPTSSPSPSCLASGLRGPLERHL